MELLTSSIKSYLVHNAVPQNEVTEVSFFFFFGLFRAAPMAYAGSQARGRIRTVASGLHHGHSNARSEPRLQTTPQLTATLDPLPIEQGQGSSMHPHGC